MSRNIDSRLASIDEGITALRGSATLVADTLRFHGEALNRILDILTPDEEASSGPPLHELIGHLITRLDRQSVMLRDILVAQGKLARDLPLDVVRVIDDNLGGVGQPPAGASGGKANGGSTQP